MFVPFAKKLEGCKNTGLCLRGKRIKFTSISSIFCIAGLRSKLFQCVAFHAAQKKVL